MWLPYRIRPLERIWRPTDVAAGIAHCLYLHLARVSRPLCSTARRGSLSFWLVLHAGRVTPVSYHTAWEGLSFILDCMLRRVSPLFLYCLAQEDHSSVLVLLSERVTLKSWSGAWRGGAW